MHFGPMRHPRFISGGRRERVHFGQHVAQAPHAGQGMLLRLLKSRLCFGIPRGLEDAGNRRPHGALSPARSRVIRSAEGRRGSTGTPHWFPSLWSRTPSRTVADRLIAGALLNPYARERHAHSNGPNWNRLSQKRLIWSCAR